jgi:protein TonB
LSDLVITPHMTFSMAPYERPAARRLRDESLMGTALVVSLLLHLLFLCGGALVYWLSIPAAVGPRAIDVTLVELSAFDTVLPPPQLSHQEPKARAVIPPPKEQRVERIQPKTSESLRKARYSVVMKREPQPHTSDTTNAAPAATNSAASIGGGNEVTQKARVSYHHMVATLLAQAKRYPERAVRSHVTGSGSVRVTIAASGAVEKAEVATSTQSNVLDDELLRMVDRAAPFPPFPSEMHQSDVTLLVPVSFRLEN